MKKGWQRWIGRVLVTLLITFVIARIYFRVTDDFRIANMTYEMPHHPEWEVANLSSKEKSEIDHILRQEFSYIGKGAQSYAFSSEDGEYVLKFFKFKHLKPNLLINLLPPISPLKEYKEYQVWRKQKNLQSVFTGYHLAHEMHKKESGILYVHLNPTTEIHGKIKVRDKLGFKREVDLDAVVFVLQEKAKTTRTMMQEALNQGDIGLAKKRMNQIFALYFEEYQKGIYDRDHGVMHNTGFVGERPIHLDVGKLTREEAMKQALTSKEDFEKIILKFEVWLKKNYPTSYSELSYTLHQARLEFERVFQ